MKIPIKSSPVPSPVCEAHQWKPARRGQYVCEACGCMGYQRRRQSPHVRWGYPKIVEVVAYKCPDCGGPTRRPRKRCRGCG